MKWFKFFLFSAAVAFLNWLLYCPSTGWEGPALLSLIIIVIGGFATGTFKRSNKQDA